MFLRYIIVALCARTAAGMAQQMPLVSSYADKATIVSHEAYPRHSLSFRAHRADHMDVKDGGGRPSILDVCPGATDGYTGYLNSGDKHFYFAYFESRSNPQEDPLVMWINGGPGCSSMTGLLMELGPCRVNEGGATARNNEYSWINSASIFFLDQPIGVGFSYSDNTSDHASGSLAASEDVYAFMHLWYKAFPDARSLPFSIAGESYGGHYIPIFAHHIQEMNQISSPEAQIPLESVLIGNGIYSFTTQTSSYYDISCTNATGIGPILDDDVCKKAFAAVGRCEYLLKACEDYPDPLICYAAGNFCNDEFRVPFLQSGRNPYDVSKPCDGVLCFPIMNFVTTFLHRDSVREAFGVNPETPKFEACSDKVSYEFEMVNDRLIDTRPYVTSLLESGLRVLIYVGTYDWRCNFVGNERVFGTLPWEGMVDFRYQQENNKQTWSGGLWWESGPLRYVRINGAGHMVPYDKPEDALKLFQAWLNKELLS